MPGKILAPLVLLLATTLHASEAESLFDGETLEGWDGLSKFWSVEDGAITGRTTAENRAETNTFLVWTGGEVEDFELTLQFKMTPGDDRNYCNSGIQFRSEISSPETWEMSGYQADFEYGDNYSGILYEEKGRGILARRGQKVVLKPGSEPGKPERNVTGSVGDPDEIQAAIDKDGWNHYRIVVEGNRIRRYINDRLTVDVTDETEEAAKRGKIGLQVHAGPPMTVQFKHLKLARK